MLRSGLAAVLRPLVQSARCLRFTPKSGHSSLMKLPCIIHIHRKQLSLSSHLPRWSSSKESTNVEHSDEHSKSVSIKQHMSTLSADEREEYAETELQKLSPQEEKCLRVLEMEYDVWISTGSKVPEEMTQAMWLQLLHTFTRNGRLRLYRFWFKRECAIRNEGKKKELRLQKHLERQAEKKVWLEEKGRQMGLPEGEIPFKNSIHMFVRPQTMLKHQYSNMAWAMQFGQPLIMDLSLESHMRDRERTSLIKQLFDVYGVNKKQLEPFNLVMTGLHENGLIDRKLRSQLDMDGLPLTITSESYLDLYPREQLVYLTPDSPNELLTWSHHDVYIIGALVDLANSKPLTLAKAKSQGLRTARLPIDRYMLWKQGGKSLTLDIFMKIICDMKDTGDWVSALRHIASRKAVMRPQVKKTYVQTNTYKERY